MTSLPVRLRRRSALLLLLTLVVAPELPEAGVAHVAEEVGEVLLEALVGEDPAVFELSLIHI